MTYHVTHCYLLWPQAIWCIIYTLNLSLFQTDDQSLLWLPVWGKIRSFSKPTRIANLYSLGAANALEVSAKNTSLAAAAPAAAQRCALLLLNRLKVLMSNDFGLSDVLKLIFPSLPRQYYNYFLSLRWTSKKERGRRKERKPRPVNRLLDTAYVYRKSEGRQ